MSIASARRTAGQAGFTMIEIAVAMFLVVIMALVVERTLDSTRKAETYLSAVRKATERGHQLTYEIRELATASRRLFQDDDDGRAYLDALDLDGVGILPGARMPKIDPLGDLGPDEPGEPRTGNILFFVGETDATPTVAEPTGPTIRYIDTYRFVCCYPNATGRRVVVDGPESDNAVDLVVWQSVLMPSYKQLMAISDPDERRNVVIDLVDRFGATMAWDATAALGEAFYDLDSQGGIASTPQPAPSIPEDPDESRGGRLVYANVQLAPTDSSDFKRRAVMGVDDPQDWTPHGFEVKIAGPSGSRTVWMRLVVEVHADKGRVAVQPCTIIVSVRDL